MGVCETLSEFKPVMHWQSQQAQDQDRHQHMLITAYDPSRDLSPNLPITTSSCQQQESMNTSSNGGIGPGQSCRGNSSRSKDNCNTPPVNNNGRITCGASVIGATAVTTSATSTAIAMCCGGPAGFKEEYEPTHPVHQQSPPHHHHHQQQQQFSYNTSHGDCKECVAAAINITTASTVAVTTSSPTTVICKTEDCRSYNSSPVPTPISISIPNSSHHPFYDYHPLTSNHHQQRSPIDYHPVPHIPLPSVGSSSPAAVSPLTLNQSSINNHHHNSYHRNYHHNHRHHYSRDPISSPGGTSDEDTLKICAGCSRRISDRFYLYAVDRQWHVSCLQCSQCARTLDDEVTCFARDGNIYCRNDYQKLFGVNRCSRCKAAISSTELVMRAKECVFHLPCFFCIVCMTVLHKGDHFGMRGDGQIYCRLHYESLLSSESSITTTSASLPAPSLDVVGNDGRSSIDDSSPSNGGRNPRFLVPLSIPSGSSPSSSASAVIIGGIQSFPSSCPSPSPSQSGGYSPPPSGNIERRLLQATVVIPPPPPSSSSSVGIPLLHNVTSPTNESIQQHHHHQQQKLNSGFYNGISISSTPRPKGRPRKRKPKDMDMVGSNLDNMNTDSYIDLQYNNGGANSSSALNSHHHHHHQRTKRMRTSFKHHQLRTMKTYFTVNHNPDAKDLKQLSQKTGLAKRVLQVWFQNARAKWRRMMNKQDGGSVLGNPLKSMEEKSCSESSGSTMESVYHSGSLSLGGHSPQEYMSPSPLDCNSS